MPGGSQREFKLEIRQAGNNLAWEVSENIVATASFFSLQRISRSQRQVLMIRKLPRTCQNGEPVR
jgi:hypothetical protein